MGCADWISGVPPSRLPKIKGSVGRRVIPTSAAPAAWSIWAKTVMPFALTPVSSRCMVSFGVYWLWIVISPSLSMALRAMSVRVAQIQFRSLRHRHFAELRIGNEAVAIGHLHLWQRLLVELAVRRQNSVQAQEVRRERVVIVDAERSRRLVGHRAVYV